LARRLWDLPWPWRIGLGVPLLAGLALAFGAAISWISPGYERPDTLEAGSVDDYTIGAPILFEEDDIWVVRPEEDEFLALYDRAVESACPLQWRREFEHMDRTGWFVDACNGAAYDLTGRCFADPCRGESLDRFNVILVDNNVEVNLRELVPGPAPDLRAEPVNPQPE
jgi:hypothetical protein